MSEQTEHEQWLAIQAAQRAHDRELRARCIADGSIVPEPVDDQRGERVIRELGLRVFPLEAPSSPPLPRQGAELPDLDVFADNPFAGADDPHWRASNPPPALRRRVA